jgi:hypothetical protein
MWLERLAGLVWSSCTNPDMEGGVSVLPQGPWLPCLYGGSRSLTWALISSLISSLQNSTAPFREYSNMLSLSQPETSAFQMREIRTITQYQPNRRG